LVVFLVLSLLIGFLVSAIARVSNPD
jgi:hypothetical protein